jgi:hypothetical protein
MRIFHAYTYMLNVSVSHIYLDTIKNVDTSSHGINEAPSCRQVYQHSEPSALIFSITLHAIYTAPLSQMIATKKKFQIKVVS